MVSKDAYWWVLEKKDVTTGYTNLINDMFDSYMTIIRVIYRKTRVFPITVGLYYSSTLSFDLFALVMDVMTKYI